MTLTPADPDYGQAPPDEGWFPDPTEPGVERRWNGTGWTDETRPSPRAQLADPAQLASPQQVEQAILSAEAFTELVDLAPPAPPTGSVPLLSVATAPKRMRGPRRLVGGLSLLLTLLGIAALVAGVYGLTGVLALEQTLALALAIGGGALLLAGFVAGAIRTRR